MSRGWRGWVGVWVLCVGSFPVLGEIPADSAYRVILERNPFGLKDAPAEKPVDPSTTNVPVKVDIKLTGITGEGAKKRAWLVIPPSGPAKPGQGAPQPKYLSLREGDEQDALKVLEIDPRAATVKVVNAGQTVVLNFKDHALPLTATPPPGMGAVAGVPGSPGAAVPRPGQPMPVPGQPGAMPTSPSVAPGMPAPGPVVQPTVTPQTGTGLKPIPARNLRTTTTGASGGSPAAAAAPQDPATQYLQMKAAEELARRYGVQYPPAPPPGPWNAAE